MGIRKTIIKALGGFTSEDMLKNDNYHDSKFEHLISINERLEEEKKELDMWFLVLTDALHNSGAMISPKNKDRFNDETAHRIRRVATFYRMFTIYNKKSYKKIDKGPFDELKLFISQDFAEVFITGEFKDSAFEKFKNIEERYSYLQHPPYKR